MWFFFFLLLPTSSQQNPESRLQNVAAKLIVLLRTPPDLLARCKVAQPRECRDLVKALSLMRLLEPQPSPWHVRGISESQRGGIWKAPLEIISLPGS